MISHIFRLAVLSLSAAILSPLTLRAADPVLNTLGAASGQALYATHMAINTLGDAWMAKVYENGKALQLAGSYEGGTKAMRDALASMLENAQNLTAEDRKFIAGMVESCDLLLAQMTAFKGYVKTGDAEMARLFESKRQAAQQKIFGLLGIDGGSQQTAGGGARDLAFKITKSSLPGGKPGRLGAVQFARQAEDRAFGVSWQYDSGGKDAGVGVPFPDSGVIAVGFGPDVLGVAIYKLDGDSVDARWAVYEPGAEIGAYTMKQGTDKTIFNVADGGGTVRIEQGRERTARIAWELASGSYTGIGVAEGNYLAAVSLKPGGKGGVAIYTADVENGSAAGRWTMTGASGAGQEELQLVSANGQKAGADAGGGGDPASIVKAIAESLRKDAAGTLAKLRPTEEQIAAIAADAAAAKKLQAYADKVYAQLGEIGQVAKPGQTEIQITSGDELPGGYQQQSANFRPGIQIYGFEYLEPGKTAGMAYDGVVNVGDRWVMIPKMWRAFAQ